ncbi:hypothetical protein FB567DRAFT_339148 [Paraphoma chrysanthemicola]|uniref:Zn(2)-C6 fungal-type domain-containing protein n=1 Tax=Paraphoma chrysanthemicola TaxID=798071 RepID=A0A8K0RA10_9PLEO|nr:hypothetical protein FB567DRAFT_339148 [Paraphoma chrysanthemicola]
MELQRSMDDTKLRNLEKQYKLRVKTGCETCRIRKVKCDEAKPACLRCTRTGRKCDGYTHLSREKKSDHATAASYRNSSFLAVPQATTALTIQRSPCRSLSPNLQENRSFAYFQTRTLPMWTEFFDSELWSRTVLQLSHSEPAIKHGILALSTMHERYETSSPVFTPNSNDFAFVQYMHAVQHSKRLLATHQEGKIGLEMVLIACIIFTCYENLAGNYHTASMHLRNGLRILQQHGEKVKESAVANVLYRFDVQAMTFSDNAAVYIYELDAAPVCPRIPDRYVTNESARDDLVRLMRCMLWLAGVIDRHPGAASHPAWLATHSALTSSFEQWESRFAEYLLKAEHNDDKIRAGNTLLKMSALTIRIVMGSGAGMTTEMAWDPFMDRFKEIVDLAERMPVLNTQVAWTHTSLSARDSGLSSSTALPSRTRRIAPTPKPSTHLPTPYTPTSVFSHITPSLPSMQPATTPQQQQPRFSPSFELSPIVPLFIVVCRCRDPTTRRRAIALLLSHRRREGVWDSRGAGMVGARCMAREEGLTPSDTHGDGDAQGDDDNDEYLLRRNPNVNSCEDVKEEKRVKDVFVRVEVVKGCVDLVYELTTGVRIAEKGVVWEKKGERVGGK